MELQQRLPRFPGITPSVIGAVGGALRDAHAANFKTVYLVSITFGGLACIAALFSQNKDDKLTGQVARQEELVDPERSMGMRTWKRLRIGLYDPVCCTSGTKDGALYI